MSQIQRRDLKPFQERAAGELAAMIQAYPGDYFKPRFDPDTGEIAPFLCRLRAITGAGKTPMLALAAQHLKTGIILWTTNRGAVISQTLTNLKPGGKYSSLLPEGSQVFILNELSLSDWKDIVRSEIGLTILLATVASFNQDGDNLKIHTEYQNGSTKWELLGGRGPELRGRSLYVFYDEGHGATERQFAKLRELSPKAFVLASASPLPEDLADLLSGKTPEERETSLSERTVVVSTKEVVDAGLLKNRLYFTDCDTAQFDAVREANDKWLEISSKLSHFDKVPIACFIVNETSRGVDVWEHLVALGVDPSKIAVHLNGAGDVVCDRKGSLSGLIDTYSGKKASDRSPEMLRVRGFTHIIWNMTLREGWDEPLAYVAYIDDRGKSTTDIVQKIGRFVRQPDANPFDDPDLNSAYFYFRVVDEDFTRLIRQTQEEMETDGYEVIGITSGSKTRSSRSVEPKKIVSLPRICSHFGDDLEALDQILLDNIPLFAEEDLKSLGAIRTHVFEMSTLQEDVSKRKVEERNSNDVVTPWDYLSTRLAAIDSRIVNNDGTRFSAELKNDRRMKQQMQYGSKAMEMLDKNIDRIREGLNEKLQLVVFSRDFHEIKPFRLVAPDLLGVTEYYREKYKVRSYKNSIHPEYNGLNPFEVKVANAIDSTGLQWCRNPAGKSGYGIPIPVLGAATVMFYPDFLLWTDKAIWAIEPKGEHLYEGAVGLKLMDTSAIKKLDKPLNIAFVLDGSHNLDKQGHLVKEPRKGKECFTLVRKTSTGPKAINFPSLSSLFKKLL